MNQTLYLASAGIFLTMAAFDRFLLKRRKVEILEIQRAEDDDSYIRFALSFHTKQQLRGSRVSYTLRDKKNPRTVIAGKERPLDFSSCGTNNEFLLFNKKLINDKGDWVLDVKITSDGSRVNPLYKIFPIETTARKEFNLG